MDNKQRINENTAKIEALAERVEGITLENKEVADELETQKSLLTSLESAVDKLPEPKPDRMQQRIDATNNCNYMFYSYSGDNVDFLEGLDMSRVDSMYNTFQNCTNLITIPKLYTSQVKDMRGLCTNCGKLTTIYLLDMIMTTSASDMLSNCTNLTNLTLKNIKKSLQIGRATYWGTLLTDESLINTAKELWDLTGTTSQKLTVSTPSLARFSEIYVKLIDVTADMIANDEYITNKKPCVVCESTDEGAMTLQEYVISKNWQLA